jgi:hypothetical protein
MKKHSDIRFMVRNILSESINSPFNLSDEQLREIARWGLTGDYYSSGCWDDAEDNIELAIDCAVEDFKSFLEKPYPMELGNFPKNPVIYRFVRLKSIEDLDKGKLGYSWFSNPEQHSIDGFFDMLDYLKPFKTEDGETYLIKAQTPDDNVDVANTLWQRSTQWIENEIVIKDSSESKVKILDIKRASDL